MVILSVTGFVRTVLLIIGVLFLLRLIGKMMIAKRNIEEQNQMNRSQQASDAMVEKAKRDFGKISITKPGKPKQDSSEFTDFEEIKED